MVSEENIIRAKIAELDERDKIASAQIKKYKKLSYAQVLQEPENLLRLERVEIGQKQAFELVIKKQAPHLISEWEDLFAEYWIDFLKGRAQSIADFLREDFRLSKKLKKRFLDG